MWHDNFLQNALTTRGIAADTFGGLLDIEDVERGTELIFSFASRTPHMHCLHHRQILFSNDQNLVSD